jgi:hypothetical protein
MPSNGSSVLVSLLRPLCFVARFHVARSSRRPAYYSLFTDVLTGGCFFDRSTVTDTRPLDLDKKLMNEIEQKKVSAIVLIQCHMLG